MFKLESYITPVLLNYVGKYVKNFRAEQSQVSLWGGDATFENLDLRLGVLNEQFDLPFTFISGHIHELLIHVPWVKIVSEPIVITINTIECILKMKDGVKPEDDVNLQYKLTVDSIQEDTPTSYIKSIVTKVVNNITINCNNLILKFVEEDIVLSVNIRFLSMQTVDGDWKPRFIDVNTNDMILRKVMAIEDLTLCLDRMDGSGKIDIYQDPVVYRCSMTIRWIMNYQMNTMKRIAITRFDLHCENMEFSMTEQQIPMLLRLITLLMESSREQGCGRIIDSKRSSASSDDSENLNDDSNKNTMSMPIVNNSNQAWGSWAWNILTSVVPVDWNIDEIDQCTDDMRQTLNFGIYIDNATLTFKTIDSCKDETFGHKNFKVRYRPFVTLNLSNVVGCVVVQGLIFSTIELGLGYICLIPRGNCSCGYLEVRSNVHCKPYICAGIMKNHEDYLKNSLFDCHSNENNGIIVDYQEYINQRLSNDGNNLLKISSGLFIQYVHCIELPDSISDDELLQFNGNFEFSNFHEHDLKRYFIDDLTLRICSGMLHRVTSIVHSIESDLNLWIVKKNELTVDELPPVTVEEFESLNDYIPISKVTFNIVKLSVDIHIADHYRDKRKFIVDEKKYFIDNSINYPLLIVRVDEIKFDMSMPLYEFRLAACASKQINLSEFMLEHCYRNVKTTVLGFEMRLNLTETLNMILIMPCNINLSMMSLIYPSYWLNFNVKRVCHEFQVDSLTLTCTKAKLMIVYNILTSNLLSTRYNINHLACSSLYYDACNEKNSIYLELSFEMIYYTNYVESNMITKKLSIDTLRVFALNDVKQTFILSAPEYSIDNHQRKLFVGQLHYPDDLMNLTDDSLVIGTVNVAEIRVSIDPLLIDWLNYQCVYYDWNRQNKSTSEYHGTDETSSDASTRKKFPSLHESVHSPSDRERKWNAFSWIESRELNQDSKQSKAVKKFDLTKRLISWRAWWIKLILNCNIEPIFIYIPTITMDGLGVDGIEQSIKRSLIDKDLLKIFVIKTSHVLMRTSNWNDKLFNYINDNNLFALSTDVILNKSNNFPWIVNLTDLSCYTCDKYNKFHLFIMESLNATIDSTIKSNVNGDNSLNSYGFFTYIDTTPITISIASEQLELIDIVYDNINNIVEQIILTVRNDSIVGGGGGGGGGGNDTTDGYNTINEFIPFNSPTQILFTDTDTISTASTSKCDIDTDIDCNVTITSWIQWTIAKITVELSTKDCSIDAEFKMIMELEDIITSIDWQSVYLQIKNKITCARILHYKRFVSGGVWELGDFMGLIMSSRDEIDWYDKKKKITQLDFLNVTITRAKSNNVYTKWRGVKEEKLHDDYLFIDNNSIGVTNYITEIAIQMQLFDILLPIDVLQRYIEFINYFNQFNDDEVNANDNLPLIYLDFKGLTLIVPVTPIDNCYHDCFIVETGDITIVPQAKNPICRVILRKDIYDIAAQANIINTPGSTIEDRQYQINVNNATLYTTTLKNYEISVNKRRRQSSLYTMNENPALEWNKLDDNGINCSTTTCLVSPFNLSFIIAPSIMFKSNVVVCGRAVELTLINDIKIILNLKQIELLNLLYCQFLRLSLSDVTMKKHSLRNYSHDCNNFPGIKKTVDNDNYMKSTKDSGVDVDMSSIDFNIRLQTTNNKVTAMPYEYLINGGGLTLVVNELTDSNDCRPLVLMKINQFNLYLSQINFIKSLRINCFDISIGFLDDKYNINCELTDNDWNKIIIETKNGDPHPNTGIPPSFFQFKLEENHCQLTNIFIEFQRPTKIHLSLTIIYQLNVIVDKIINCLGKCAGDEANNNSESLRNFVIKDRKIQLPVVKLKFKQIVLVFKSNWAGGGGGEIVGSFAELNANLSSKSRKVCGNIDVTSMMITTLNVDDNVIKPMVKPFSFNFVYNILWESWQSIEEMPLIHIQIFSDGIYLNVNPDQIQILDNITNDLNALKDKFFSDTGDTSSVNSLLTSTEQYYQDDLKAGAFHFADGANDQLPLPYQVLFYQLPHEIMSWRYPQPRILTKLSINDVLFEIIDVNDINLNEIVCSVEYWNDNLMAYQRYIEFNLTEIDNTKKLTGQAPTRAVSCLWRAAIKQLNSNDVSPVSARDLAGCMQIDSYFNSSLIPILEITFNIDVIQLALFNNVDMNRMKKHLPKSLDKYQLSDCSMNNINFINFNINNIVVASNYWFNCDKLIDLSGDLSVDILDHGTMFMQELLKKLNVNVQITMAKQINCSVMFNDIWIKFGPEVSHTITMSLDLWRMSLGNDDGNIVLFTDTVVVNDLNVPIRFRQFDSTDGYLLSSCACHFYSWRHERNRQMIVGYEEPTAGLWLWSEPFAINHINNTKSLVFHCDANDYHEHERIYVNVKMLSTRQKIVTFTGRLVISNQLNDHFHVKLIRFDSSNADDSFNLSGHSRSPSLFIHDYGNNMAIRLRFANLLNCSWTGDIPLHTNVKSHQPWLVKLPTLDKGQFLSIWVRIIHDDYSKEHCRILVVLTPLYIIKSWLPMPIDIQVDTPTLHSTFVTKLNGCCQHEQMYCPGTFEHYHQIKVLPQFNITTALPSPCITLSYNSIDQRTFFKRPDKENIDGILERLDKQSHCNIYPFHGDVDDHDDDDNDDNDDGVNYWTPVVDTSTCIQIRYRDAGLESSTLMLEIKPWCFVLNSCGLTVNLITPGGDLLCRVPHRGIASPPKIDGIFNIEIEFVGGGGGGEGFVKSLPFQLAQANEWNRGFIMPQINGLIPMDGNVKTIIRCNSNQNISLNINSSVYDDIRMLKILPNYVIANFTEFPFVIAPLIVNNELLNVDLTLMNSTVDNCWLELSPAFNDKIMGIPIVQWWNYSDTHDDIRNNSNYFICLAAPTDFNCDRNDKHWSCPVKVNLTVGRYCIGVIDGIKSIPIVITVQKDHDITYINVLYDNNPQFIINNLCPFTVIAGQANEKRDDIELDSPPFNWLCEIHYGQLSCYTMKNFSNRIPDSTINNELVLSLMLMSKLNGINGGWRKIIDLTSQSIIKFDQFVHTDCCGDIKIIVESRGLTIYIKLEPKSQMELAVCDIRSRLIHEGNKLILNNDEKIDDKQFIIHDTTLPCWNRLDNVNLSIGSSCEKSEKNYFDRLLTVYFHGINLIVTQDKSENNNYKRIEVAGFYLTNTIIYGVLTPKTLNIRVFVGDLQFDNQMFHYGGFDFPVVFISQKRPLINDEKLTFHDWSVTLENTIGEIKKNSLITLELSWDIVDDKKSCRDVYVKIAPINIYIEDRFVTQLLEYLTGMLRPCIFMSRNNIKFTDNDKIIIKTNKYIDVPPNVIVDAKIMSSPLRLQCLTIEPISILLSVHTSVRLYVALDHSPLHFSMFQRNNLFTTPYRLGNALTMHYLSGAIFGAGWVVGSLEILGSPGSFAQALGIGLKDFIAMPFQGLLQGPWGFIVGITHGSASLMKNITAGTVNSVTKLASSVARNLDRLTLDEEHLQRQEESRRIRPQGMAQGLYQGLSGFGINILAAVGGLAHHPLQHVWSGEATTRGLVTGVGLGLVGVVTKPLSGAAELVALTGQGLLHRTGWNSLPTLRHLPNTIISNEFINTTNRFTCKFIPYLIQKRDCIIYFINAQYILCDEQIPVTIILTRHSLLIVNNDDDKIQRIFTLKELHCWNECSDDKFKRFIYFTSNADKIHQDNLIEQSEMNQELRTRIEQYVLATTTNTTNNSNNSNFSNLSVNISIDNEQMQFIDNNVNDGINKPMAFLIDISQRNNLMAMINMIKRQNQGTDFTVL